MEVEEQGETRTAENVPGKQEWPRYGDPRGEGLWSLREPRQCGSSQPSKPSGEGTREKVNWRGEPRRRGRARMEGMPERGMHVRQIQTLHQPNPTLKHVTVEDKCGHGEGEGKFEGATCFYGY